VTWQVNYNHLLCQFTNHSSIFSVNTMMPGWIKTCGNIPQSKHTIPTPSVDVGTSHGPTHNPYSFGWTALILTPSIEQLQSLFLWPDSPYSQIHAAKTRYLYRTANGNSSWCQSQSQGINTDGAACQSQSQLRYDSSTSRYHASTPPHRLTPAAIGSLQLYNWQRRCSPPRSTSRTTNSPFEPSSTYRVGNHHHTSSKKGPFQGDDSHSANIVLVLHSGDTALSIRIHTVPRHRTHVVTFPQTIIYGNLMSKQIEHQCQ
jgi:hypothetical protein